MKIYTALLACLAFATAGPIHAQTQIGGGTCSNASLSGAYSLLLTGRDVSASVTFTKVSQGVGTASFDGQGNTTLVLTTNQNQMAGIPQVYSGTYTLQGNCAGTVKIAIGDTANFVIETFNNPTQNQARNFLLTGNDGTYSYSGNGALLPVSCDASLLSGPYAFNASGFGLGSGSVSSVNNLSGLLQFDGNGNVTTTWYVSSSGTTPNTTAGTYTVSPFCTATATVKDPANNSYSLVFAITSATGSNFVLSGASPSIMFIGNGRAL